MSSITVDGWVTLSVLAGIFICLVLNVASAEIVVLVGLAVLLFTGVLSTVQALAGFANEGMMTVAVLYVVVTALRETGVMGWIAQRVFGSPRTTTAAQIRMMLPVATVSAFMNNTPLVAAMVPIAYWSPFFFAALVPGTELWDPGHPIPMPLGIPVNILVASVSVILGIVGLVVYRYVDRRRATAG